MSTRSERSAASLLSLVGALLLPLPWIALAPQGFHASPVLVATLSGAAILGAAFLLSWAAELIQMDVSQALALALLALHDSGRRAGSTAGTSTSRTRKVSR